MSKEFKIEEVKNRIELGLKKMYSLLDSYINSKVDKDKKRAFLMSYWINDYTEYIKKEDEFDANKLIKYKRGNLVIVNLGYRVGRELGGRHFAIVLDNDNKKSSPVVTVLPLTSLKQSTKINEFVYVLQKDIYSLYMDKQADLIRDCSEAMKAQNAEANILNTNEKLQRVRDFDREMKTLKKGSVVQLSQITTISKQRIVSPKNISDGIYGIKIAKEDMENINERIKKLYIFGNKS